MLKFGQSTLRDFEEEDKKRTTKNFYFFLMAKIRYNHKTIFIRRLIEFMRNNFYIAVKHVLTD